MSHTIVKELCWPIVWPNAQHDIIGWLDWYATIRHHTRPINAQLYKKIRIKIIVFRPSKNCMYIQLPPNPLKSLRIPQSTPHNTPLPLYLLIKANNYMHLGLSIKATPAKPLKSLKNLPRAWGPIRRRSRYRFLNVAGPRFKDSLNVSTWN